MKEIETLKNNSDLDVKQNKLYIDNNPLSARKRITKFIASSFVGFISNIIIFVIISLMFSVSSFENIMIATVAARLISGLPDYIMNKKFGFNLKGAGTCGYVKYFLLFTVLTTAGAIGTMGITMLLENPIISKIIVEIFLLFFSYTVRKNWVFVKRMNKRQMSSVWKSCTALLLVFYLGFTLLNRFVISQNVVVLDKDYIEQYIAQNSTSSESDDEISSSESSASDGGVMDESSSSQSESDTVVSEPVITETSYSDENIQVTIDTIREYNTEIYIAEIIISDSSLLKAGLAENSFGINVNEKTSVIAEANNAIIAINGDYYGFRDYGYVMRNGYLYRETETSGGNEDLVVYPDGSMEIVNEADISAKEIEQSGAVQIFSFGPGLISNGEIIVTEESEVDREDASNPRTAIAMIAPNHYIFMVADGRTDESEGLSLYEMADVLASYNCEVAYNLDGGGSATMVFMGEVINNPTTNGRDFKERSVSDIVFIG